MKLPIRLSLIVSICIAMTPLSLSAHSGASGVVKERMDGFKAAKKSMRTLKNALRSDNFSVIVSEASSLESWFSELDSLFPVGSNPAPSEALDSIWEEFNSFSGMAKETTNYASLLRKAAHRADSSSASEAYFSLAASCKACHDDYRE